MYYPAGNSGESYVNDVYLGFTSGASGAVPTTLTRSNGITSVVRNSTGNYTVTFDDSWVALVDFSGFVNQASYSASGAVHVRIKADALATVATHTVTIETVTAAGAVVDMASGDKLNVRFGCQLINVQ